MKQYLFVLLALASFPAISESPFDGTWVWDTGATELSEKPDVYLLANDIYHCESCVPAVKVEADGNDHPVQGQPFETVAVTVVAPDVVKIIETKAGELYGIRTLAVSADGKQLTNEYKDHSVSNPVTSRIYSERISESSSSAHAISGLWRQTKIEVSDSGARVTLKVTKEGINFKDQSGIGYEARFDGKEYPMTGVNNNIVVKVNLINDYTFEETAKRDGKLESVIRLTVAPDGKTASYVYDDKRQGVTTRGKLYKEF